MSFSSICDTHSVSSGSVEGEVSSIGAFPVIVRIKQKWKAKGCEPYDYTL
jgi:hypothetical protein